MCRTEEARGVGGEQSAKWQRGTRWVVAVPVHTRAGSPISFAQTAEAEKAEVTVTQRS